MFSQILLLIYLPSPSYPSFVILLPSMLPFLSFFYTPPISPLAPVYCNLWSTPPSLPMVPLSNDRSYSLYSNLFKSETRGILWLSSEKSRAVSLIFIFLPCDKSMRQSRYKTNTWWIKERHKNNAFTLI